MSTFRTWYSLLVGLEGICNPLQVCVNLLLGIFNNVNSPALYVTVAESLPPESRTRGFALIYSLPVAFLVAGAVGVAIERGLIRFLYGRPLETMLATWGLSLALQQAVEQAALLDLQQAGAAVLRVHDVPETVDALKAFTRIRGGGA